MISLKVTFKLFRTLTDLNENNEKNYCQISSHNVRFSYQKTNS